MILQSLVDYYERKAADPESGLAEPGFERKEIPFVIVIDRDGHFVMLEDTREIAGKKKRARSYLVPQGAKKTSGVAANLLWDTAEYAVRAVIKSKLSRVDEQHAAFMARLDVLPAEDPGIFALRQFLAASPLDVLQTQPLWPEIQESNPVLSFRMVEDVELIAQRPSIVAAVRASQAASTDVANGICLVSGNESPVERLHAAIKGVWGSQSSGANIVSFNQRSFESYGKEQRQGENAPVGQYAAFAYTTALNHLLGKDSSQRIQVGDTSTVFWANKPCELEDVFQSLWSEPQKDDPDRAGHAVQALYRSVQQGFSPPSQETTRFFVLGLAPNAARISIRFWQTGSVAEFSARICQHFTDIAIEHAPHDPDAPSLYRLLVSTAGLGKSDNIPPNLAGDVMRAILSGLPYPSTLLYAVVRRIRAEQTVNYYRAALIKACLNRFSRHLNQKEDVTLSLDLNNSHPGYRLGRLFAVLEKIQEEASPGLNTTIRDRFYGAASSSPVSVFANLMKLKNHHLAKIENKGRAINLEKIIGEIMDGLDDFPSQLSIHDQGRFAVGYYHQKQSFYKKSDSVKGESA